MHESKFQRLISSFISNIIMKQKDLAELADLFDSIDTNMDGVLDRNELEQYIKEVKELLSADENNVVDVFDQIDSNGDNKIEFSEFVTAVF